MRPYDVRGQAEPVALCLCVTLCCDVYLETWTCVSACSLSSVSVLMVESCVGPAAANRHSAHISLTLSELLGTSFVMEGLSASLAISIRISINSKDGGVAASLESLLLPFTSSYVRRLGVGHVPGAPLVAEVVRAGPPPRVRQVLADGPHHLLRVGERGLQVGGGQRALDGRQGLRGTQGAREGIRNNI
eukprot:536792-Prorocentrum_minimum.AAC.2